MELRLQKDMRKAVELWEEAAELGSVGALHNLGVAHYYGQVFQQDKTKGIQFWTKAAMQGHFESRYNLGAIELNEKNHDRAVKHFLISAKMGHKGSLEMIKNMFMAGDATKEQYAQVGAGVDFEC